MADLNPFHEDIREDEITHAAEFDEITLGSSEKEDAILEPTDASLDAVAARLLKDNLILTALELHTELVESRKELPRLRDFFSNPGNFERTKLTPEVSPLGLPRTSSIQTFDSLDFARYSDDGDRQEVEKVAVLEFELRKAHETIKSLRASLTKTADTVPTPDSDTDNAEELASDDIKPHELRAVNFLVNEYLLTNNYKITSVTFAEENENQDFEDWDDVGLNTAKPPDLLHLYRDYGQHQIQPCAEPCSVGIMVNLDEENGLTNEIEELNQLNADLKHRIDNLEAQIQTLNNENAFVSNQIKQFERISDASVIKSSTPVVSPINTPNQTPAKAPPPPTTTHQHPTASTNHEKDSDSLDSRSLGDGAAEEDENHCINDVNNESVQSQEDDSDLRRESEEEVETSVKDAGGGEASETVPEISHEDVKRNETEEKDLVDGNVNDALRSEGESTETGSVETRKLPRTFQEALMKLAFQASQDNRIVSEVRHVSGADTCTVVLMLGRCLPHIVPNVILAKREELIPVILMTATLHPEAQQRDQLLNILFNLIKKPDLEQRHMILVGCVAFAQFVGPERVESELLPQCWEQIAHKYWERRLLVAEACGALAAYLPPEIRSSLVLSMLQQMLEDEKSDQVRQAIVTSLGILYGFVSDPDKYIQGGRLLMKTLVDPAEGVSRAALDVFLPTFAMWTLEMEKLEVDLYPSFLRKLIDLVKNCRESNAPNSLDQPRFTLYTQCMHRILSFLFLMILKSAPFAQKATHSHSSTSNHILSNRLPKPCSVLTDISVISGSSSHVTQLVELYEAYISEEWYEPWDSFAWVAGEFIPEMINFMNTLEPSLPSVVHSLSDFFHALCRTFGRTFTTTKIKQKFQKVLSIPENHKVSEEQVAFCRCTAAVYAAGVLAAFNQEEDNQALESYLKDLMTCLSLSDLSLTSLKAAFQELSEDSSRHDMLLAVLWEGVVHAADRVRNAAATLFQLLVPCVDESLLAARVVPALVTLASDPQMSVRVATVPAFGTVVETASDKTLLAKIHMQLDTFVTDPAYQHEHSMHVSVIHTLARVGPNAEPWFRDEFVLPRLAVFAASNNHVTNATHKREVALQLFEAYSALSCCFVSSQVALQALVPGLRCLLRDVHEVAPHHVKVLESMLKEFEDKVDSAQIGDKWLGQDRQAGQAGHGDAAKSNVFSRFKDVTSRFSQHKK